MGPPRRFLNCDEDSPCLLNLGLGMLRELKWRSPTALGARRGVRGWWPATALSCRSRSRRPAPTPGSDPAYFRPREDMNVRRNPRRLIERPCAHIPQFGPAVLTKDRDLAIRTAENPLGSAIVTGHLDRLWRAGNYLHPVCLDHQVDHEGTSSLPLAVQAMTAVDEKRIGPKPVANRPAGAAAFTKRAHDRLSRIRRIEPRP